jgi:uncharacterized protein (DUF169 family)
MRKSHEGGNPDPARIRDLGRRLKDALVLENSPVGVRLLPEGSLLPSGAQPLRKHRYCQAVMRARHGEEVVLDGEGLACPAAARAFGFRPLPENLESGKGLVGFGIVSDPTVGRAMFKAMPRLDPGAVGLLHLFPLEDAPDTPDVVLVEDEVERLMWLALAYVHATGGERVQASTAVLQAVCADATLIPYTEGRLNLTYGCYGCREATDILRQESLVGFPVSLLEPLVSHLEFLQEKAMPVSRSKRALQALREREPLRHPQTAGG